MDLNSVSVHKHGKKRTWSISSHLDLTLGQKPIHNQAILATGGTCEGCKPNSSDIHVQNEKLMRSRVLRFMHICLQINIEPTLIAAAVLYYICHIHVHVAVCYI